MKPSAELISRRNSLNRTARRFLVIALAFVLAPIMALEWPVSGGFPLVPFGSFRSGRFSTAMTIEPARTPVTAVASGDIAFQYDGDKLPSGLPCTLGSFVAVHHPDGLISVYGHLDPGSMPAYIRSVETGGLLGRAGESGFRSSFESTFALFDRVKRQYLNPQVLLPPVKDDRPPVVRSVYLIVGENTYALGETRAIRQGTYEIQADIRDPLSSADTGYRAPYSVRLMIDGKERVRYIYNAAKAESGTMKFFGSAKSDCGSWFLANGNVRLGSYLFSHGRSTIVLAVSDYAGNEREITNTITVE